MKRRERNDAGNACSPRACDCEPWWRVGIEWIGLIGAVWTGEKRAGSAQSAVFRSFLARDRANDSVMMRASMIEL